MLWKYFCWIPQSTSNWPVVHSDVETLTWSCFCTKDTTKVIENWQFPIPFKLCRNQLSICLQDCTIDEDQNEINVLDEIQPWQQQPLQQQRYQRESGEGPGGYHDFDQDDWDAIEELQLLRDHSKLETDSYSRFKEEDVKSLKLFKKKKQLHKKVWDRQRNEISKIMAEESEGDGDFTVRKNIVEFATYTDPKALRDPSCVNECQAQFSCGTGSAPQFHGPKMVKNINV